MRKLAAAVAIALVAALCLVASSQGGGADGSLPIGAGHVKKVSPKALRLGHGRFVPFEWTIFAEERPSSHPNSPVCFSVGLYGPFAVLPGGGSTGPETGGLKCGPIKPARGIVLALPVKDGSMTPPSGETESWKSFDVGIAAYPPSVDQVRLIFIDGGSEVLKPRAVPGGLAFEDAEPFHYVVFAVHGCVSKVQGLTKGKVVARVGAPECAIRSAE